jgi:hypothetical protein
MASLAIVVLLVKEIPRTAQIARIARAKITCSPLKCRAKHGWESNGAHECFKVAWDVR